MSIREEHPLDRLFRQKLMGSEAAPPTSVWEGIVRARRDRGFWTFRGALALALLVTLSGLGAHLLIDHGDVENGLDNRSIAGAVTSLDGTGGSAIRSEKVEPPNAMSIVPVKEDSAPVRHGRTAHSTPDPHQETARARSASNVSLDGTAFFDPNATLGSIMTMDAPLAYNDPSLSVKIIGAAERQKANPGSLIVNTGLDSGSAIHAPNTMSGHDVQVGFMKPRHLELGQSPPPRGPIGVPLQERYVLSKAEWWVGAQVGSYSLGYNWRGNSDALVSALNEVEARTSTLGAGIIGGRSWQSGWGIAAGIVHERTEQAFHYTERTVLEEQEISTYLVTLNTQVFVSDVDTTTTFLVEETETRGSSSRTVLRIPLEGYWHKGVGRWSMGPRAGLAMEFVSGEGGYSLLPGAADGPFVAIRMDKDGLKQRYPTTLVGSVGIDVGYMLNERWSVWARPGFMKGLTSFQGMTAAEALPERYGLQFSITHHFLQERSK